VTVRQNAHLIAPWIAVVSLLCLTSFLAYMWIFPEQQDRQVLAATIGTNPAFSLIFGIGHDLLSPDGFNAWRSLSLGSFFAGLMTIFIVVRETRAKEDSGQAEIIGANVVGRYTPLAVAVVFAYVASLMMGIVTTLVMLSLGGKLESSILLASAFTASGMMFASVAAVTCQLASYARAASSMAVIFLGICFLLRGYADTSPDSEWALWFTPFGWLQKIEPAGVQDPSFLLLCGGVSLVLISLAGLLLRRRDFGEGVIPTRRGRVRAGLARTILGLALKLQTGSIISWTIAFASLGSVFGFLISSLDDVFTKNATIASFLGGGGTQLDLAFEFVVMLLKILGIIAAVYGIQVMMRVYSEEMETRVEPLLAGTASRAKFFASHVIIALAGPAVAIVLAAVMIAFVSGLKNVAIDSGDILQQAVVEIPAIWVLIGLSVATIGAHPIARFGAWVATVITFILTLFGPMFKLWDWVQGISPLWHVPVVSELEPDWNGLFALIGVAIFLLVVGFLGFRRRDIGRVS